MTRLIDADALKEYFKTIRKYHVGKYSEWYLADVLEQQPTIDAEPVRHGKWKCTYLPNGFLLEQTCSECGLTFEEPSGVDYNYCPQCGCRMDKDE